MAEPVAHRPPGALAALVTRVHGYRMEPGPPGSHQGVASGHLTLILCQEGRLEMLANADPAKPPGTFAAMVAGLHTGPARIATGAAQTGLQLDLTWRGARALLGVPAAELAGDTVDLAAVLGRTVPALLDRLATAATWADRFAVLDTELAALARRSEDRLDPVRPEVAHVWDRLVRTGGTARVTDLAADLGWSRRHLGEHFRAETGLTPKGAARVIRFERACTLLRRRDRPALVDVAITTGYADQAHLARDFRDLAGQTATSWLGERRPATAAGPPARRG
jgi:AraC-like DNA-binding protein